MLAARAGGTVDLHLIILRANFHVLTVVFDIRDDFDGGKGGLTTGVGVKGRYPHQTVNAVLPLQEAVGVLALDHNRSGFQTGLVALLIVHDLVGEAVTLRPAGVHAVEHLTPVLGFGAASACLKAHHGVVLVVMAGEQSFQTAGLHILCQRGKAGFQLLQHGIVVFFLRHLADGHQIVPVRQHFFIMLDLALGLAGLDNDFLALLRVVPETGGFLHSVQTLQLIAHPLQIQGIRQSVQRGAAVVQLLLICVKFNIHHKSLISLGYRVHLCIHVTSLVILSLNPQKIKTRLKL